MKKTTELPSTLIGRFVIAAHSQFEQVQSMLQEYPTLLTAHANVRDELHLSSSEREDNYETALEAAVHSGNQQIARFLIEAGAPLDICAAAMLGMAAKVREFLAADPKLLQAAGAHSTPILFIIAAGGSREVAEIFLTGGCEVNITKDSHTPLHIAARFGHLDLIKCFLEYGADPLARDAIGRTPLEVAVAANHSEAADVMANYMPVAEKGIPSSLEGVSKVSRQL